MSDVFTVRTNFLSNKAEIIIDLLRCDAFRALNKHIELNDHKPGEHVYERLARMYEQKALHLSKKKSAGV